MPSRPDHSVSIYQSLLGNLAVVIVLLSGAIMALTFVGSQATVERLSGTILQETIHQIELELGHFFKPVVRDLTMMRAWEGSGLLTPDDAAAMNRLLVPILQANPQLSAIMIGDDRGREHILFHFGDTWRSRQTRRDVWGDRTAWLEWTDARPDPIATARETDYDPRQRPWYQGAVATLRGPPASDPPIYWTEPYTFYTAKAPGMTAATAFEGRDGCLRVVAIDLLLTDVSAFTTRLRVGEHGAVMVLTEGRDGRQVIGLPRDPRYLSLADQRAALLKPPEELQTRVVADATRALLARGPGASGPLRLVSAGDPWWAELSPFPLGPARRLTIEVMVPESDLLGTLGHLRLGIVLVMLAGLALAMVRAVVLARRYSRPIEALVRESERISRGDLDPGPDVATPIREVHRLADAHGRMRLSLKTLLRLEGDLKVARRIQQDTLPDRIPSVPGFDIDAWSEPADETGGDTYDVIGYRRLPGESEPQLTVTEAERAVLLLADASGHGVGPALSVTQVRAMLRMAVRSGEDLPAIVRHLNAQLCADLTEGRFVSAWLGELDTRERTLTGFSCGQGPLLYYRAAERTCVTIETDSLPFGCVESLEVQLRPPIRMEPGDVFVALSDGVGDAENASGDRFGTRRIIEVVTRHGEGSASELLTALRRALADFAGATAADDDRTGVIVKRL
ncbi:MAG TPA: SpoIIE family protein phosphatase [Candidatus Bathyarchaeia archaeon]|nr:SpoIIE family protein phosphatase [Candidatus Bathyarchaeia archaeon]